MIVLRRVALSLSQFGSQKRSPRQPQHAKFGHPCYRRGRRVTVWFAWCYCSPFILLGSYPLSLTASFFTPDLPDQKLSPSIVLVTPRGRQGTLSDLEASTKANQPPVDSMHAEPPRPLSGPTQQSSARDTLNAIRVRSAHPIRVNSLFLTARYGSIGNRVFPEWKSRNAKSQQ